MAHDHLREITMTVGGLRKLLADLDSDLPVFMRAGDGPLCEITRVNGNHYTREYDEVWTEDFSSDDLINAHVVVIGGGGR
jgi:hypothetical protein